MPANYIAMYNPPNKEKSKEIVKNGHYVNDERGSLTKEVLNVVTCIKDPFGVKGKDFFGLGGALERLENIRIPDNYFWEGDKLQVYSALLDE